MMPISVEIVFWTLAVLILYVYGGYPLLLLGLSRLRPARRVRKGDVTPTVSLIIPAYNEEKVIEDKLRNSLALDYPKDRLQIIVASDGSIDSTDDVARKYETAEVKLVALDRNQGKSAAENAAVTRAGGEVLFFSDANVMLRPEALRRAVANFADSNVGCVVGQVTYVNHRATTVSEGEGIYWRYELFLRRKESELGNLAMGSGPIMAIRRSLFSPLDARVGEDFVLPMQVALKGYRVVYEPTAVSEEVLFQNTLGSMFNSKVRIISKDLRGLLQCRSILNPFRYPLYAWGLTSHKILRWLVPYFLLPLFILNLFLLAQPVYLLALAGQVAFYALALAGFLRQRKDKPPRILGIPFSFCLVNLAALVGVTKFCTGRTSGRWTPVRTLPRTAE